MKANYFCHLHIFSCDIFFRLLEKITKILDFFFIGILLISIVSFSIHFFSLEGGWKCCQIGKSGYFGIDRSSFAYVASPKYFGHSFGEYVCGEIQGRFSSLCCRSVEFLECGRSGDVSSNHQTLEQLHESHGTEYSAQQRNAYASSSRTSTATASRATGQSTSHSNPITKSNKCACGCRCCRSASSIAECGMAKSAITRANHATAQTPNDVSTATTASSSCQPSLYESISKLNARHASHGLVNSGQHTANVTKNWHRKWFGVASMVNAIRHISEWNAMKIPVRDDPSGSSRTRRSKARWPVNQFDRRIWILPPGCSVRVREPMCFEPNQYTNRV